MVSVGPELLSRKMNFRVGKGRKYLLVKYFFGLGDFYIQKTKKRAKDVNDVLTVCVYIGL